MGKDMKKSNKIIIILFIAIIVLLIGAVIKQSQNIKEVREAAGTEDKQTEKVKEISKEEFRKYIKQIDITTENWKDYFEMTEEIKEQNDDFGEVASTQKLITLKLNDNYYNKAETTDITLEFEIPKEKAFQIVADIYNKRTIKLFAGCKESSITMDGWAKDNESITIDDIKCTRATGTIYYLDNIPDEYWNIEEGHTVGGKTESYINVEGTKYYKYNSNYKYLKDFME